jgi:catechol 2,3-dioxygenase-like lactoylglutathione lyase family enzyme
MLSGSTIAAVVPVTDLERARRFYEDLLGLEVFMEQADRGTVVYHSAGTNLMVYERPTASSGEHTVAAFIVDVGDFDSVIDRLVDHGITFDTFEMPGMDLPWDDRGVLQEEGRASAWFKDPDGNVLSIGAGMT